MTPENTDMTTLEAMELTTLDSDKINNLRTKIVDIYHERKPAGRLEDQFLDTLGELSTLVDMLAAKEEFE